MFKWLIECSSKSEVGERGREIFEWLIESISNCEVGERWEM